MTHPLTQTRIAQISTTTVDQEVHLAGWIEHIRTSGKIAFIELRDGSGYIQCVIEKKNVDEATFEQIKKAGIESSLTLTGTVSAHPKKTDVYEIHVSSLSFITLSQDYPLGQKEHGVEFLYDNRHLHLRTRKQRAIQRIRDTIIHATYDWMRDHGYTKIDSPVFTATCAEDSTELYSVTHTNDETMYLNQTGQMYIEAAIAGHGRVYDFGPVFRAEKSKTRRHLNELWMMDAETAFCDNDQNMDIQEALIKYVISQVLATRKEELTILTRDIEALTRCVESERPRITHAEIVKQLQAMGSDIQDGEDLGGDDEEMLMNHYQTPIFVTNFPLAIKAFYMPEDPAYPGTAKCSDLLAPQGFGEVIGGSERIGDAATLQARIEAQGYDLADYQWYLDTRTYGGVTTSGFGFGLERLVRWICDLHHIREAIPFPRYHNRITP